MASDADDVLDVVLRNARRLCEDAGLLVQEGRWPTAMALAVLSIEECGKYGMLRRGDAGDKRRHSTKQQQAALGAYLSEFMVAFRSRGSPVGDGQYAYPMDEGPELVRQSLAEAGENLGWLLPAVRAHALNFVKLYGLYVDVDG